MKNLKLIFYIVLCSFGTFSSFAQGPDLDVTAISANPNPGIVGQTTTIIGQVINTSFSPYVQANNGPVQLQISGAAVMDLTNATLGGADAGVFTNLTCIQGSCVADFAGDIPALSVYAFTLENINVIAATAAPETFAIELIFPFGTTDPDPSNFLNLLFQSVAAPIFIQDTTGFWDVASNWIDNAVPTANDDAIIDTNVISTVRFNQEVKNLETRPGSIVTINNTFTVEIKEDLTNDGKFEGEGYVVFDGTVAQNIRGTEEMDGVTDAGTFTNIRVDNTNGLTLENNADIFDTFDVDNGSTFTADAKFTFRCEFAVDPANSANFISTKTAQVDEVNGTINSNNNFVTEQCYPGRRAYRLVSPSATTLGSIRANWQEGASAWNDDPNPGYGTHITGVAPDENTNANTNFTPDGATANGLDWQPSGDASMFTWDIASKSWIQKLTTSTPTDILTAGSPYRMMIRGSRAVEIDDNTFAVSNTILRETGNIAQGNVNVNTFTNLAKDDIVLIGNPYQAIVNLANVYNNSSNINRFVAVWDPRLGGVSNVNSTNNPNSTAYGGRGAFVVFDVLDVASNNNASSEVNELMQPMQAVFFQATANGNVSIPFREIDKQVNEVQTQVFSQSNHFKVSMQLFDAYSYNQNSTSRDGFVINFVEGGNNQEDQNDFMKLTNADENMARWEATSNSLLSIEQRGIPAAGEELPLFINRYRTNDYVFNTTIENPTSGLVLYLKDKYTGNMHLLEEGENAINFSVDANLPASTDNMRFSLVFELETLGTTTFNSSNISVYPNPVADILNVSFTGFAGETTQVQVVDMLGKIVYNNNHQVDDAGTLQITNLMLEQGGYIVKVIRENGDMFTHKILKK